MAHSDPWCNDNTPGVLFSSPRTAQEAEGAEKAAKRLRAGSPKDFHNDSKWTPDLMILLRGNTRVDSETMTFARGF